jgi:CHAD domain-containing protein
MRENLQNYYQVNRDSFEQHLIQARSSDDMELIHQLRLCVKRISALYSYFRFLEGKKTKNKPLKVFSPVYKPAGSLRDLQVQWDMVKTYEKRFSIKYALYKNYLQQNQDAAFVKMKEAIKDFNLASIGALDLQTKKLLDKYTDDQLKQKAAEIFEEKLDQIKKLNLIKTNKDKNLHTVRRILKEIRYLLDIFKGQISEVKSLKVSYDRLKQIEKTLGTWHDLLNAEEILKNFLSTTKLEEGEILRYKILNKSINRFKNLLLKRIKLAFKFEMNI